MPAADPAEPSPSAEHRRSAPASVRCGVVTISDTRTLQTDSAGPLLIELLDSAGHEVVARQIVPDEPLAIRQAITSLASSCDAVLLTGGTGISPRDRTYETLEELFTKILPGYGELFRMLSYQQIGPAAMLSRAIGGLVGGTVVASMPGSPAAVRLAMEQILLPELGHLVGEARKG